MIELGYATFDNELSEEEIERRKNATPVYLITETGCGWVQRGIDKLAKDLKTWYNVNDIIVTSGTDLLDKTKLITKLKETPNTYIVLSYGQGSPIIVPSDINNIIEYLEQNINTPETTWKLLVDLFNHEHPIT